MSGFIKLRKHGSNQPLIIAIDSIESFESFHAYGTNLTALITVTGARHEVMEGPLHIENLLKEAFGQ